MVKQDDRCMGNMCVAEKKGASVFNNAESKDAVASFYLFFFFHFADKNTGFIPWIFLRAGKMQSFCGATISVCTCVCVRLCVYTH